MPFQAKTKYLGQICLRAGLPLSIFTLCAVVLAPQITQSVLAEFPDQLRAIPFGAWCAAIALTIISLWTVGRYDCVAHRHFATRVPAHQARVTGTISIALAQTLGFGLLTGAMARWRMLGDVSLKTSLKLSAFVSISFMVCWAVVTAFACLLLSSPHWTLFPSLLVLAIFPFAVIAMFRWPSIAIKGRQFRFPNLQSSAAILFWTMIDTTAVAGAMFVLLPQGADISFTVFLPLFLMALGTALLSNTPGGVGPFELMMLSLLPQIPAGEILGSIVAFRLIYYALPASISFIALIKPFAKASPVQQRHVPTPHPIGQAEVQVIAQNGGHVLSTVDGTCAVWPTTQALIMLCNPISGRMSACIDALACEATLLGKSAFVYKCGPQNAAILRKRNWSIMHISDDAILNPLQFDLDRPPLRRLRRKLRAVKKNEVVFKSDGPQPWHELQIVDHEWQTLHATARGGTMGRFEQGYLSTHFIARAEINGRLCAFVTFQRGADEWCLDVMRHTVDLPDGTMHALVHAGIMAAKQAGVVRLSLAATPACPDPHSKFYRWAARQAVVKAGGTGLRQFKSTFAPKWEPRYAGATTPHAMLIGLADITREVHHPDPILAQNTRKIHNFDEYYELASSRAS